jgi:hypothetical protein
VADIAVVVGTLAAAVLLGSMAFFSAVIAPLVFIKLDSATAGRFIRSVFPWYYLVVLVFAAVAAAALAAGRPVDAGIMAAVALAAWVSRQLLMPRINACRDRALAGDAAAGRRFDALHRASVWINAAQLLASGAVMARLAAA